MQASGPCGSGLISFAHMGRAVIRGALHVCRALNLPRLDQTEMVEIRTAWFEEVGGPPTGNKCEGLPHRAPPFHVLNSLAGRSVAFLYGGQAACMVGLS